MDKSIAQCTLKNAKMADPNREDERKTCGMGCQACEERGEPKSGFTCQGGSSTARGHTESPSE